jgi:hypothetical protein
MNLSDHSLQRLLRSAAQAPKDAPASPPVALEAGVLAQWRNAEAGDDYAFLVNLFRRAVVFASLIMVLSIAGSWLAHINESPSKTTLANYALTVQLRP